MNPDSEGTPPNSPIILFDGTCMLCNSFFKWIIKHDQNQIFRFATIQSDIAKTLIQEKKFESSMDTVLLIHQGQILTYSSAVLRSLVLLGGFPSLLGRLGLLVPKIIRDPIYRFVSKNRYGWFGSQTCMIPDEEMKKRFVVK